MLYVEDNVANLRLVERLFARSPRITLLSADNGADGLRLARETRPALILLDLQLPAMPGLEVLRRLQQDEATRSIPVVIVTADATPARHDEALAAGARAVLVKPLDVRALLGAVQSALPLVQS